VPFAITLPSVGETIVRVGPTAAAGELESEATRRAVKAKRATVIER